MPQSSGSTELSATGGARHRVAFRRRFAGLTLCAMRLPTRFLSPSPFLLWRQGGGVFPAVSLAPPPLPATSSQYLPPHLLPRSTAGYRSGLYAKQLRERGFDAHNLAGSILAWVRGSTHREGKGGWGFWPARACAWEQAGSKPKQASRLGRGSRLAHSRAWQGTAAVGGACTCTCMRHFERHTSLIENAPSTSFRPPPPPRPRKGCPW